MYTLLLAFSEPRAPLKEFLTPWLKRCWPLEARPLSLPLPRGAYSPLPDCKLPNGSHGCAATLGLALCVLRCGVMTGKA